MKIALGKSRRFTLAGLFLGGGAVVWWQCAEKSNVVLGQVVTAKDDAGARAAFVDVYRVFTSARCANCHPKGNAPLQGDEMRVHAFQVQRGPDGKGTPAMRCTNCHQTSNAPGEHAPPGVVNWQMPSPEIPMVFEGRTPRQLAEQLKDPKQTHGRTLEQVLEHMSTDQVRWAWNPGPRRSKPPVEYETFVARLKEWVAKGGAAPEESASDGAKSH